MAPKGNMSVTALELPAGLGEILAQAASRAPKKPATIDEARKSQDELLRHILHGCDDEAHRPAHEALVALIRAMFKVDLLPERVQKPFVDFLAFNALHSAADHDDMKEQLAKLFDGETYSSAVLLANVVAAVYERPDLMAGTPEKPKPVGQYL